MPLTLDRVSFGYGDREIVSDVSLIVSEGEAVALVGPSGSGKSTLLAIAGGIVRPERGSVAYCTAGTPVVPRIAWVFQQSDVFMRRTAFDNVAIALRALGYPELETRNVARAALDRVGLASLAGTQARRLSGGEVQRVCIARALAAKPHLLLADEPTGQLDRANTAIVTASLLALREVGTSCLIATHDPAVAALCDRTVHLGDDLAPLAFEATEHG